MLADFHGFRVAPCAPDCQAAEAPKKEMSRAEKIEAMKKDKEAKEKANKKKDRSQIVLEVKPVDTDVGESTDERIYSPPTELDSSIVRVSDSNCINLKNALFAWSLHPQTLTPCTSRSRRRSSRRVLPVSTRLLCFTVGVPS